jgi:hypothetical protein
MITSSQQTPGNLPKMGSGCDKQQKLHIIEPFPDPLQAREESKFSLDTAQDEVKPSQSAISNSQSTAKDVREPEAEEEL